MSDLKELRVFLDRYGYEGKSFESIRTLWLNVYDVIITELPPHGFTLLPNLEVLNLSNNQLTCLPEGLGYLPKLTRLDLSGNVLTHLPEKEGQLFLGDLPKLTYLNLYHNQLTYLPECMGEYTTLHYLYIRNNPLQYIPFSFKKLNVQMTFEEMEEEWIIKEQTK